ncbi:hypothetical protein [Oceanobacillus indicireducens]|uniref:Uncharacterized protein n=1 Tax=Oceanobacillus indicireducens TaxID=1004261 RepID=A0A917Y1A9_9BACI|nr:hypothetical protein [Oceanobacillus indicireducens]GGN63567.1 hypothetical protein GCM10007971_30590 [Oceanobacillus indicireducens]
MIQQQIMMIWKDFQNLRMAEHIDLDTYQGVVETDNKGNRIFIKHDNRIKIVQFNDDGLLYNGIIK